MTFDINDLPEHLTVVDDNGIPDHVMKPGEILDDGFTLALAIGAADGDEATITTAVRDVQTKYGDKAGYVLSSAIVQFSRDLLPAYMQLARTVTGVDFAAHCQQMNNDDYNPQEVDR